MLFLAVEMGPLLIVGVFFTLMTDLSSQEIVGKTYKSQADFDNYVAPNGLASVPAPSKIFCVVLCELSESCSSVFFVSSKKSCFHSDFLFTSNSNFVNTPSAQYYIIRGNSTEMADSISTVSPTTVATISGYTSTITTSNEEPPLSDEPEYMLVTSSISMQSSTYNYSSDNETMDLGSGGGSNG